MSEQMVDVYAIEPTDTTEYDIEIVEDFYEASEAVRRIVEHHLGTMDEAQLKDAGFTINIKLRSMKRNEVDNLDEEADERNEEQ